MEKRYKNNSHTSNTSRHQTDLYETESMSQNNDNYFDEIMVSSRKISSAIAP